MSIGLCGSGANIALRFLSLCVFVAVLHHCHPPLKFDLCAHSAHGIPRRVSSVSLWVDCFCVSARVFCGSIDVIRLRFATRMRPVKRTRGHKLRKADQIVFITAVTRRSAKHALVQGGPKEVFFIMFI